MSKEASDACFHGAKIITGLMSAGSSMPVRGALTDREIQEAWAQGGAESAREPVGPGMTALCDAKCRNQVAVVVSQPKPRKRIVDPAVLRAYAVAHPRCEIRDCWREDRDVHHLVSRGRHGDDVEENLLALCSEHHMGNEGWHALGVKEWLEKFDQRLEAQALVKVMRAVKDQLVKRKRKG